MNIEQLRASKILIIDDAEANLRLLEELLTKEGFEQVISTTDPTKTMDLVNAFQPDLILLDLMMPVLDGFAVLDQLSHHVGHNEYLPVLVLTADATIATRRRALALGAKDFLTKPFDPMEAMLRVWILLETRWLFTQLKQHQPDLQLPGYQ
ncbi:MULTISPECIES: response regulator [unclassified Methylophilus]|jgi:CheY-like chemotaxis protein|uniref:Response regulator n=1 Tax=Methylophilus glucosoxydans TaxID=752553 RepID=A0ABW3GQE3_9PROT|nr:MULTISPECIES: response regulator [unclassified Methylophilus]MBF5038259.1 response regulator [Methylophilus sp. 13]MDF0378429.1 response regulator [Methylophilus sp. YYY-1]MDT7848381.1 response regulator [Methylophilus sp. VKM B-3414]BEV07767.1 response regulator [Methylophilus sp. DW102]